MDHHNNKQIAPLSPQTKTKFPKDLAAQLTQTASTFPFLNKETVTENTIITPEDDALKQGDKMVFTAKDYTPSVSTPRSLMKNARELSAWIAFVQFETRKARLAQVLSLKSYETNKVPQKVRYQNSVVDPKDPFANSFFVTENKAPFTVVYTEEGDSIAVYDKAPLASGHKLNRVYFGYNIDTDEKCAVKFTYLDKNDEIDFLHKEVYFLKKLHQYIGFANGRHSKEFVIVEKLIIGYDLFEFLLEKPNIESESIQKTEEQKSLPYAINMAIQFYRRLQFIHVQLKCLHRDIKLENIMIDLNGNIEFVDFEFMVEYEEGLIENTKKRYYKAIDAVGTPLYVASEIRTGGGGPFFYTAETDIFASGIILAFILFPKEMARAVIKFGGFNSLAKNMSPLFSNLYEELSKSIVPTTIKNRLYDLIADITSIFPSDRPSIDEILNELNAVLQLVNTKDTKRDNQHEFDLEDEDDLNEEDEEEEENKPSSNSNVTSNATQTYLPLNAHKVATQASPIQNALHLMTEQNTTGLHQFPSTISLSANSLTNLVRKLNSMNIKK